MASKKKSATKMVLASHDDEDSGDHPVPLLEHAIQLAELARVAVEELHEAGVEADLIDQFSFSPAQLAVVMRTNDVPKALQEKLNRDEPSITLGELVQIIRLFADKAQRSNSWRQVAYLQVAEFCAARLMHELTELVGLDPESAAPPSESDPNLVYQFKITLQDSDPAIWRRIQIQDCTLEDLHFHIQAAMGWENDHLHQFKIGKQFYGDPEMLTDMFGKATCIDSTETWISQIVPKGKKRFRFTYEYDFGDSWMHEIEFEGSLQKEADKKYPICTEGARACPPEDIGGLYGYYRFLEAVADPESEDRVYDDEFYDDFDADYFDAVTTTAIMTGIS
jgi:hypothetical protein